MNAHRIQIWSDEPASVDLLAFGAIVETAVEVVLDDELDPIALGISGPWGSGKTTILKLIKTELESRETRNGGDKILVVEADPWRYDPDVGAKGSFIFEVISALQTELEKCGHENSNVEGTIRKLIKRVNWIKSLKLVAQSSITLQIPEFDDLLGLINECEGDDDFRPRNLDEFHHDFRQLLNDEQLNYLKRVVVLVDDLDRCPPDTVVDTLETMRLFLSVPKMSFIIAADEDRVADALRQRYPRPTQSDEIVEEPANLYLHKIVQTTLRLPALSRYDTEAYLLLLQLQRRMKNQPSKAQFQEIIRKCSELRVNGDSVSELENPEGIDVSGEMDFAVRLTPILYEKLQGSPRRVKRFLNDLRVRESIAERRGIKLDGLVFAKLMVLELLLKSEFSNVIGWLANGKLRSRLADLEKIAGQTTPPDDQKTNEDSATKHTSNKTVLAGDGNDKEVGEEFSDDLIRWARFPPMLAEINMSPYLHLAASFVRTTLIDAGLPVKLRDIAHKLISQSSMVHKSVTDSDLCRLQTTEIHDLIKHFGRMASDRPSETLHCTRALLRVAEAGEAFSQAKETLMKIPVVVIKVPIILLFQKATASKYREVLLHWKSKITEPKVLITIDSCLND